ncbi:hypothetical protein [Caldibacillus debilis]|nr:hypothetical protein [Caldibacillus debilis]
MGKEEFMKKGLTGCKIKETEGAKAMAYQEYPDNQPIEKECLEGNGGNFFNHHEKKTDFSASFYSL